MDLALQLRVGDTQHSFPLTASLTIGRAPDNDVVLDDTGVSRHHAVVSREGDQAIFSDLGSANGSAVNSAPVEPRQRIPIAAGDTIEIGDSLLRVVASAAGPAPFVSDLAATRIGGGRQLAGGPRGTLILSSRPRLEIVSPDGARDVALEGPELSLGRDPANDIVVSAEVVSRRHLTLRRRGPGYELRALDTPNGVSFHGERIQSRLLEDGDVLDVAGEVALRYHLEHQGLSDTVHHLSLEGGREILIGRGPDCDLRLDHPAVSLAHARLAAGTGGQHLILDLGSTNGTFVNGERIARGVPHALTPGDLILVGPVRLDVSATAVAADDSSHIGLIATGLNQRVREDLNLLQDLSFVIEPQEFVAVVGVSGAGKSTLLGAISGLRPASNGQVLLNGASLYAHFQAFRTSMGYVPQDDILHRELPVIRALNYSAELRLPDDTPAPERRDRVDEVVRSLGLAERRETPVGQLSGGQRKRVSIGAELITRPGLFFLDEATSGLDPGTESQLMRLLRGLADEGHTIVLITHATKNVMLCDQVLFLARGGFLAYFGPPDQALTYFEVEDFDGIYERLEAEASPEEWGARYAASAQHREFIADRLGAHGIAATAAATPARKPSSGGGRTSSAFRQLRVLSVRYFDIIRRDRVNLALLFLLAPVLALVDLVAWPGNVLDRRVGEGSTAMTMLFLSALIPFLVGSLSFVREIVKEAPIYTRERAVALRIWPYLGSKIAIGTMFALYHAAALFALKALVIDFPGAGAGDYMAFYVTLSLNVISGVMWALLISAITSREEQAMMLIIGVIVLQVVFSGGLVPLSDLGPAGGVLSGISSTAWSFKALTAAVGLNTEGCSGDFAACNLPGIQGLETAPERQLAFKGVNAQFGDIFGGDVLVSWGAMAGLIVAIGVVLYILQRRKDTV